MTWGLSVVTGTLLALAVALAGATGATSIPTSTLPLLGAVKSDGSIWKASEETWLAVAMVPGMMANVLPWPELKTKRPSRTSGARHRRRRTRGNGFDVFIGPPWPVTEVGSEDSFDRGSTESRRSRMDPPGRRDPWCHGRFI